jgi:hypothetical protein
MSTANGLGTSRAAPTELNDKGYNIVITEATLSNCANFLGAGGHPAAFPLGDQERTKERRSAPAHRP